MKNITMVLALCAALPLPAAFAAQAPPKPLIQIAILLDTSNSMDGLIAQAKTQLWQIVNEFATARRDGVRPELQVALYEYGNNGLPREGGYIRRVLPLTTDLDKVSEELFRLKTNGGDEYCGRVIRDAVRDLAWSASSRDAKAIFIAGNEPFTQGDVPYAESCRDAVKRGIAVNTLFCGNRREGIDTKWQDGALLSDGCYTNIDPNAAVARISAPQDRKIAELGAALNATYIPYGGEGRDGANKQKAMDAAAESVAPAARAAAKAGGLYRNSSWDLVDALEDGKVKLEDVKKDDLPETMREMTPEERKKYVARQMEERKRIQKEIGELNKEREAYVAAEEKKAGGAPTLGDAVRKAARVQAEKAGFEFK